MLVDFDTASMASYRQFLKLKRLPVYSWNGATAVIPDEYSAAMSGEVEAPEVEREYKPSKYLFDYQRDVAAMAIRKQKFAVFAECGLGKTAILLEFARHALVSVAATDGILIVSPLMVIPQTISEANRFYPKLKIKQIAAADLQAWLNKPDKGTIGITNYEAIREGLTQGKMQGLILDECFPRGTLVDIASQTAAFTQKRIEDILPGDMIRNASGIDHVVKLKKRKVSHAVAVYAGTKIISSPNHPFFTQRGWVGAQDLEPGDSILSTRAAMRMVRSGVSPKGYKGDCEVLRSILFSEMADVAADPRSEGAYGGSASKKRSSEEPLVCSGERSGECTTQEDFGVESDVEAGCSAEGVQDPKGHEAQTFRAWWEWDRLNATAEDLAGCTWSDVGGGICLVSGPTTAGISNTLQARLSESRFKSCYRSGWRVSLLPQEAGCEEDGNGDFIRVDGIEILEPGHPELERLRDASGELYFYDLEAERHPSFSVSGLLVHNSSMLKSHYGAWGLRLIDLGRGLKWKLCLTGTPAPNDRIEYANHSIFLDHKKTTNEFLARYFVNRGETQNRWEIKPHALRPFYRDLSHWCIFLSNPATYGWKDNCETIPPIKVHIDHIDLTTEQRSASQKLTGTMFVNNMGGIGERGKLSQLAKGKGGVATNKPEFIRNMVDSWPDESTIIWCHYNDEQESMERVFPDAVSISGDTPHEKRLQGVEDFKAGRKRVLISKPRILGFGLNLQIATRQVFSGLQDSYEEFHQAVKRSNRVGSTRPLNVHIPVTELEEPMIANVLRKADRVQKDTEEQEAIFKSERL